MTAITGNMKQCSCCEREKGLNGFNRQASSRDGFKSICRACQKENNSAWWRRNPEKQAEQIAKNALRIQANREYVVAYLREHPCVDCGESDIVVLDFHHRDPCDKLASVSKLVYQTTSVVRIDAEIVKCDVLCANCHRRHTAKEQGWFKALEIV